MAQQAVAIKYNFGTIPLPVVSMKHLTDERGLPQPLRPLRIWSYSLLAPLLPAALNYFEAFVVHGHAHLIDCLIVYMTSLVLVYALLRESAHRRTEHIRRYEVVAECNHHIRNALQVLVSAGFVYEHKEIKDAADRIESTLREVLPEVHDKPMAKWSRP